jgi:hypothetical protein
MLTFNKKTPFGKRSTENRTGTLLQWLSARRMDLIVSAGVRNSGCSS